MQDALLMYYMVANLMRAGYFADVAKGMQKAVKQLRRAIGSRDSSTTSCAADRGGRINSMPTICRELEDWMERLTRMESYVLSAR